MQLTRAHKKNSLTDCNFKQFVTLFFCERRFHMFNLFSKRILWIIPILAASLFTTACGELLSVTPLATDSNTVFDPNLVGTWGDSEGSNSVLVCVRKGDKNNYDILWIDTK